MSSLQWSPPHCAIRRREGLHCRRHHDAALPPLEAEDLEDFGVRRRSHSRHEQAKQEQPPYPQREGVGDKVTTFTVVHM